MKRSKQSLSHYKLLSCDMGKLIPLTWYEALPGDTIQQRTSALVRATPLLAPVMHPVVVRIHHWFVPNRLIWDDWEDFITGGEDGNDASVWPHWDITGAVSEGTLHDYLGVPPATYAAFKYSALPHRAYALIYNEFYRDQDLVTKAGLDTTSGTDTTTNFLILNCAWEKDYFTTARTSEQKGTEVTIPLGGDAPVKGIGMETQNFTTAAQSVYETGESSSSSFSDWKHIQGGGNDSDMYVEEDPANAGYPGIFADLSAATGVSINDLRLSLAIQRYQENRSRFGSRFQEYLRYLGVRSSDGRLQRPEFLGGGRQTIQFSEVLQTAEGGSTPVGKMLGHGISAMRSRRFRRFFEEHGIVMSLMSIVPKSIYAGGLHRGFSRDAKEDYWQKELQAIGDQAVLNKEIYTEHATPDGTFGYQSRYDEYRYHPSSIAGEFRSTSDHWHYARIFGSDPSLNSTFVQCSPTKRVNADQANDVVYVMANHSIQARRLVVGVHRPRTF